MGEFEPGFSHESLHTHETYEELRERYAEYESMDRTLVERFLTEGEVRNIAPIEALSQPTNPHKDLVYTGDMTAPHRDLVLEGEVSTA